MKRLLLLGLLLVAALPTLAQGKPKFGGAYYDCRLAAHQREGMPRNALVWLGDSSTEQGWWTTLTKERDVVNRGIGGDNTYGMLARLPEILASSPRKIFLMAGVNDLSAGYPVADVVANIRAMVQMIGERVPTCEVYVQSVLIPNNEVLAYDYIKNKQAQARALNASLEQMCGELGCTWVNLVPLLSNEQGEVRTELTKDGIHLHPEAYYIWVDYLKKMKYLRK